jgi:hypothetical protein
MDGIKLVGTYLFGSDYLSEAYKWQSLLGAIIGASVPILLGLIGLYVRARSARIEKLKRLDRTLVLAIKSVSETQALLETFYHNTFVPYLSGFVNDGKYQLDLIFIPAVAGASFQLDVKDVDSGSSYIDSNALLCLSLAKDFDESLADSRKQLSETYGLFRELAFSGQVTPQEQSGHLRNSLEAFSKSFYNVLIKNNSQVLLDKLVETKVVLDYFQAHRYIWRIRFSRSFRLYKTLAEYNEWSTKMYDKIDKSFFKEFSRQKQKMQLQMSDYKLRAQTVIDGHV